MPSTLPPTDCSTGTGLCNYQHSPCPPSFGRRRRRRRALYQNAMGGSNKEKNLTRFMVFVCKSIRWSLAVDWNYIHSYVCWQHKTFSNCLIHNNIKDKSILHYWTTFRLLFQNKIDDEKANHNHIPSYYITTSRAAATDAPFYWLESIEAKKKLKHISSYSKALVWYNI